MNSKSVILTTQESSFLLHVFIVFLIDADFEYDFMSAMIQAFVYKALAQIFFIISLQVNIHTKTQRITDS